MARRAKWPVEALCGGGPWVSAPSARFLCPVLACAHQRGASGQLPPQNPYRTLEGAAHLLCSSPSAMASARFTTYERVQSTALLIAKRDGQREASARTTTVRR